MIGRREQFPMVPSAAALSSSGLLEVVFDLVAVAFMFEVVAARV